MMTRCQDHILTENIWFVCSKTAQRRDVNDAGRNDKREDNATQPMDDWKAEFRNETNANPLLEWSMLLVCFSKGFLAFRQGRLL